MDSPSVSIGILNWNGKHYLQQFLPALYNLTYPNYKLYVIDNASTDGSVDYLKKNHPAITIIETGGNYGVAGGYNRGFRQIPGDYLLMLNSDVESPPGFIEPMVELMEKDPNIAICQSKLLAMHSKQQFEYGGAAGGMIDILGYPFCRGRILDTIENDHGQYDDTAEIFWAGGASCLIRRNIYFEVDGMYEYFFMQSEELDMCWKMRAAGYKIVFCPRSFVYHVGGGSLSYQSSKKTYYNFKNNLVMICRNSPLYVLIWLLPVRCAMDVFAAITFLLKKDPSNFIAVFKAYKGFLYWLFKEKNKWPKKRLSLLNIDVVFKGSIVWSYFVNGKKRFSQLKK